MVRIEEFTFYKILKAHGLTEPAQEAVRKHGLCKALVRLLVTPEDARENISGLLPDICQLLDIATDGECRSSKTSSLLYILLILMA